MLRVGETVLLTRSGLRMRVEAIYKLPNGTTEAMCCWTNGSKSRPTEHHASFAVKYLESVFRE